MHPLLPATEYLSVQGKSSTPDVVMLANHVGGGRIPQGIMPDLRNVDPRMLREYLALGDDTGVDLLLTETGRQFQRTGLATRTIRCTLPRALADPERRGNSALSLSGLSPESQNVLYSHHKKIQALEQWLLCDARHVLNLHTMGSGCPEERTSVHLHDGNSFRDHRKTWLAAERRKRRPVCVFRDMKEGGSAGSFQLVESFRDRFRILGLDAEMDDPYVVSGDEDRTHETIGGYDGCPEEGRIGAAVDVPLYALCEDGPIDRLDPHFSERKIRAVAGGIVKAYGEVIVA